MFVPLVMGRAVYSSGILNHYDRYDWQNSVRLSSSPSRTVYSDTSYDSFGIPYFAAGTLNSQYAGLGSDISSGSEQVSQTRRYHPTQGRWLSPDSWGISGLDLANPQSFNRYAYVGSNPLSQTDPNGQCWPPSACGLILMNWGNQITNFAQQFPSGGQLFISSGDVLGSVGHFVTGAGSMLTVGASSGSVWDSNDPKARTLALADDFLKTGSLILTLAPAGSAAATSLAPVAGELTSATPIVADMSEDMSAMRAVTPPNDKGGFFYSTRNNVGGTVWQSQGLISQGDFKPIVEQALSQGQEVNVITGIHGGADGTIRAGPELLEEDLNEFGNSPGVNVFNYSDMNTGQIN
jgi:RHS repeat-associated protein